MALSYAWVMTVAFLLFVKSRPSPLPRLSTYVETVSNNLLAVIADMASNDQQSFPIHQTTLPHAECYFSFIFGLG